MQKNYPNQDKFPVIEMLADSLEAALAAKEAGADQLELTGLGDLGGITPSVGLVKVVKERVGLPIFVMIRPRQAGFCYSIEEIETMEADILALKDVGADGFVFGCLRADASIDLEANQRLLKACGDRPAVFHRASDIVPQPEKGIKALIDLGFTRVLTKGAANTLEEGLENMKNWKLAYEEQIQFIYAGIRPHTYKLLYDEVQPRFWHLAARKTLKDPSLSASGIFFGGTANDAEAQYNGFDFSYAKDLIESIRKLYR